MHRNRRAPFSPRDARLLRADRWTPRRRDVHWADGWTAVTKDGKPSAQFEHQLLMHESGAEILTARLPNSPPLWWEEGAQPGATAPVL